MKVGVAGAAVLAAAHFLDAAAGAPAKGYRILDGRSASTVERFAPVVLAGTLPGEREARVRAIREIVASFDRAVAGLSPAVQREVEQLFSVLHFAPTRIALAGLWAPLDQCTPEEIAAFLTRWRFSRFELQRAGYQALSQLIQAAWFDNSGSWAAIGYPGPPALPA